MAVENTDVGTLASGVVTTVTFNNPKYTVNIENRGTVNIYVRLDGTNPAVDTDESYLVRAGGAKTFSLQVPVTVVKLIATGTPDFNVEGEPT